MIYFWTGVITTYAVSGVALLVMILIFKGSKIYEDDRPDQAH